MTSPAKRVAVIGVHGVGDHPPFVTARELGDLLSDREYEGSHLPRYAPFTEQMQRISVRPVKAGEAINKGDKVAWGPLDRIAHAAYDPAQRDATLREVGGRLDHEFMRGQLSHYSGEKPEDTYQLLRLEGERLKDDGSSDRIVHIYEMFWSDLSGVGNAAAQIFVELYQLLFHLMAVGANNVKAASIHFQAVPDERIRSRWKRFDRVQTFTEAILAWPIPILTLFMAAVLPAILGVSLLRSYLTTLREFWVVDGVTAALVLAGCGFLLTRRKGASPFLYAFPLFAIPGAAIAVGIIAHFLSGYLQREVIELAAAIILLLASFGGVFLLLGAYEKTRPGSTRAGAITLAVFATASLVCLTYFHTFSGLPYVTLAALFNLVEVGFLLSMLCFYCFYFSSVAAHLAGGAALRAIRGKKQVAAWEIDAARRTRWTAQLTLAISSILFSILTLTLWTGTVKMGTRFLPGQKQAPANRSRIRARAHAARQAKGEELPPMLYSSILDAMEQKAVAPDYASRWIDQTVFIGGLGALPFLLGVLSFSSLMGAWIIFPSLATEFASPATGPAANGRKPAAPLFGCDAHGRWLSTGFPYLRKAGKILYATMLLGIFAPVFLLIFHGDLENAYLSPGTVLYSRVMEPFVKLLGTLVAGAAVGLLGFGGRLSQLALGFRPIVRVGLDVDNWLREHPLDSNPTARICGRYVSLLRYVLGWKDTADEALPYDVIVIVAHSQGSVITADLLRFLQFEHRRGKGATADAELSRLLSGDVPVYLFTMGCPLRQLYSLRFPFLYGWARQGTGPNPDDLGVRHWTNAYRSGDYIGRCLWPETEECGWEPVTWKVGQPWPPEKNASRDFQNGKWDEFCIGGGAHMHYWDSSAVQIAEVLDYIIAQ